MKTKNKSRKLIIYGLFIVALAVLGYYTEFHERNYKSYELINMTQKNVKRNAQAQLTNEQIQNNSDFNSNEEKEKYININTAGISELDTLYGIGEKMAQRIIDYRKKHGDFEVIEDIMKVPGIGEKTFEKIKDKICVE